MTGATKDDHHGSGATPGVRHGRRLGIDVGTVRIGVAATDPDGLLATPVETVSRGAGDRDRIVQLASDYDAIELVVGLPVSLSGADGPAARSVRSFVADLLSVLDAAGVDVSVRLVDERLTTVSAERALRARGTSGRRRRAVVDQAAAVEILQHAVDAERATGRPPGEEVRRHS